MWRKPHGAVRPSHGSGGDFFCGGVSSAGSTSGGGDGRCRAWLETEDPAGLGPVLPKPAAKKAQPSKKRVTMAQLSEQAASLAGLLPGLIDEVKGVVERQNRLEQASAAQASPAAPLHQQPFPQPGVGAHAKGLGRASKAVASPCQDSSPPLHKVTVPPAAEPSGSGDSSLASFIFAGFAFGGPERVIRLWDLLGLSLGKGDGPSGELASGSSAFFLQVAQEGAHRRLFPALPCPTSLWELGFLLTLLEDPAPTLFSARSATANTRLRAFSPLVPQPLAAVTLTYVREADLLAQRRKKMLCSPAGQTRETKRRSQQRPNRRAAGLET